MKALVALLFSCLIFPLIGQETNEEKQGESEVFTIVEVMPEFPGGMTEMLNFLGENIDYPKEAQENGETGTVILRFIVDDKGKVDDVTILKSISPSIDEEALRVVNSMPDWSPGYQRGRAVFTYFTLPIRFKLESSNVELSKKEKKKKKRKN